MTGDCAVPADAAGLAQAALASVDCLVASQAQAGHAALLAPGGSLASVLTASLIIYVAIVGYRLVLGQAGLSLREITPHFIKIGVVLALTTNWPSYQQLVFELLFRGPEQLADGIIGVAAGPGGANGGTITAVQLLFDRLTDQAALSWSQSSPVAGEATGAPTLPAQAVASGALPPALPLSLGTSQFVSILLWFAAAVLLGSSVGVVLVARVIVALLLVFGPLFILLALFPVTRGLFEGWLRAVVKFALVPLFALPLIAVMVAVAGPLAEGFADAPVTTVGEGPAVPILLTVLVFAAVMAQAARLGGTIASAIRLPRAPAPDAVSAPVAVPAPTQPLVAVPESRAAMLVHSLSADNRGRADDIAGGGGQPLASRALAAPVAASASDRNFQPTGRLGQNYRRLAVTTFMTGAPR
jgi:type IV secretion system protein VirB6